MALARTKYGGELAVLLTWLCALLPWSITAGTLPGTDVAVLWIRFLPLRFLYILGASVPGQKTLLPVWEVPGFVGTAGETTAAWIWIAGTVLFLVPLAISVVYYLDRDRVESFDLDPVRVQGALLVGVGLVFAVATGLLWQETPGATVPVGTLFFFVFGVILLRLERVETEAGSG